jgi:hypothetical protein
MRMFSRRSAGYLAVATGLVLTLTGPLSAQSQGQEVTIRDQQQRQVGIPAGEVYTSNFNRAFETAVLAGFKDIKKTVDLTEGGLVVSPDENSRRAAALRKMLVQMPEKGKNTFLITHKPNIIDALGKDWFDVKEGEASIFKPEDGTYRLVARVQMEDWPNLAVK